MIGHVHVNLKQFAAYTKQYAKEAPIAIVRGMTSGMMLGLVTVQRSVREARPASANGQAGAINTGAYLQRWKAWLNLPSRVVFHNDAEYSGVIEEGRRKGSTRPPIQAIEIWARRRLGLSEKEAKPAAFAIANAIAKRGLRARRVMKSVEGEIRKGIVSEIQHELEDMFG